MDTETTLRKPYWPHLRQSEHQNKYSNKLLKNINSCQKYRESNKWG